MLSMGNVHLNTAIVAKLNRKNNQDALKDSYKFFYHVLHSDSRNVYGANGLGVICAEKGQLDAAKEIFLKVLRKCNVFPSSSLVQSIVVLLLLDQGSSIALF